MKIVVLAFNIGISKGLVNGPGVSLWNFLKFASKYMQDIEFCVYTRMQTSTTIPRVRMMTVNHATDLVADIKSCDLLHCWSGLTNSFLNIIKIANLHDKPVVLGPNLLDTVNIEREKAFLEEVSFEKILTVNNMLTHFVAKRHKVERRFIEELVVGPDAKLWEPPGEYEDYILWKGNASHKVKDVEFAKIIAKKLNKYKFLFLGDVRPYDYYGHMTAASKAYIYINTSFSETKGMALLEQWAAGVPSVTHPKIFQHGRNYQTGIVTNKDVESYCDAISEIMENKALRAELSSGARRYIEEKFPPEDIAKKYKEIIKDVC